jgi:hypothetical protein
MIKKILLLSLFVLATTTTLLAQENSLENQFNDVIKTSNSYEDFKVIKKVKINTLKSSVLDSVSAMNKNIDLISEENKQQKNTILKLRNDLNTSQNSFSESKENEDAIKIFGISTKKSTYKIINLSIIVILLLVIFIFAYKFKNGNTITKLTTANLQESEEEFEIFRQRSLEREQKLRRKLQDELNKNKES